MKQIKRFLAVMLAVILLSGALSGSAEGPSGAQPQIERLVISYAAYGDRDIRAQEELAALDPETGDRWLRIMDLWEAPVTVNSALPDDLPRDDTLCLAALGFQLNPDGTMREELIERLKVLLTAAAKYPQAVIVRHVPGRCAD